MPTHNTIFIPNFCRSVQDQGRDPVLCEKTIMFSNSITIYRCNSETNGTWPDSTDRGGGTQYVASIPSLRIYLADHPID